MKLLELTILKVTLLIQSFLVENILLRSMEQLRQNLLMFRIFKTQLS